MNKTQLVEELNKLNLSFDIEKIESLMEDTLFTNEKFNLTAIKDKEKFRELMLLDSAIPLTLVDFNDKKILDVGTGAGYPGLVLSLLSKGNFTLLDSTKKKIDHINEYVSNNNINNVIGVVGRAEEYISNHRNEFDIVIARAVSSLNILLELCIPYLKVGGYFIAMKGRQGKDEIEQSKRALSLLGCKIVSINELELPESKETRINIVIQKEKDTNKKYPRLYKDIVNKPL